MMGTLILGFILVAGWNETMSRANTAFERGDYSAALDGFEAAARTAEQFTDTDPRLATALTNVGISHLRVGQYVAAERNYRRVIGWYETKRPDLRHGLATVIHNYAVLEVARKHWDVAQQLYSRAYLLILVTDGPDSRSLAAVQIGMGELAQEMRLWPEAERRYQEALRILERCGARGLAHADLVHNIAVLLRDTGHAEKAAELFKRAIAEYEGVSQQHPRLAIVLRNYAELEADRGHLPAARDAFDRALAICASSDHPMTAIILSAQSRFFAKNNQPVEAEHAAARARSLLAQSEQGKIVHWRELLVQ